MRISCAACAIVLCAFLACGSGRPSVGGWERAWGEVQAAVPDPGVTDVEESRVLCTRLLTATRELRGRLLPSPEAALDGSIRQWLEFAGSIGFNCPAARDELDIYRDRLRELAILTAEVDAGLALAKRSEQEAPVAR